MSIVQDLDKADRAIKDLSIKLSTVKMNLDAIQREIDTVSSVETALEDNVRFLKKNKIVAMAEEYRKAKSELVKTRIRMTCLQNDRERYRKAYREVELLLEDAQKKYGEIQSIGDNNVVRGKFGRKNGKG